MQLIFPIILKRTEYIICLIAVVASLIEKSYGRCFLLLEINYNAQKVESYVISSFILCTFYG